MSSISSEEIISILKSEIENYELETKDQEVGNGKDWRLDFFIHDEKQ